MSMEPWQHAWRVGIALAFNYEALKVLYEALVNDDPTLIQGATLRPPPLRVVQDWEVEAADVIAYVGWKHEGLNLIGEADEYFARMCFDCDQRLGEPGGIRHFLNFWDETPRDEARRKLILEVERSLELSKAAMGMYCPYSPRPLDYHTPENDDGSV